MTAHDPKLTLGVVAAPSRSALCCGAFVSVGAPCEHRGTPAKSQTNDALQQQFHAVHLSYEFIG
jgi:hypothetical protein